MMGWGMVRARRLEDDNVARARRRDLQSNSLSDARAGARSPSRRSATKQNQAKPSQAKLNQAILLGFIWFYSSESGLFNGLQRIQIKISLPVSGVERGFSTGRLLL